MDSESNWKQSKFPPECAFIGHNIVTRRQVNTRMDFQLLKCQCAKVKYIPRICFSCSITWIPPLPPKPELCVSFDLDIKLCVSHLVLRLVVRLCLLLSDVIVVRWKK